MIQYVLVIAWVAVKFGIKTTSVALKMGKISQGEIFNETRVVFIPNFTAIPMLFPVNTILAAYTHAVHQCCYVAICHYVLNRHQH